MNKEKILNFLYYNWLKIAAVVFVIVFSVLTFVQCSGRSEIDLGIMYVGESPVSEKLPLLAKEIEDAKIINDADADGIITINTKAITIPDSKEQMIQQQVPEQIQVEIISGENLLYILPQSTLLSYAVDESFADITDFAKKYNVSDDRTLSYEDGRIYAISIEGNKLLEEKGISTKGMYIAIRNYMPEDENTPLNINARQGAEFILERN